MKKVFLFSIKIAFIWIETLLIAFLALTCFVDATANQSMLLPLILLLSAGIIFTAVYFFRGVSISLERVRCVGPFSSRDDAMIKEDRTLTVTLQKRGKILVELFGYNTDGKDSYAWLKNENPTIINLFRAKANGGKRAAARILKCFEFEPECINAVLKSEKHEYSDDQMTLTSEKSNNGLVISIHFKETI